MKDRIIGGIILIAFSVVLLSQPWQLFARNGAEVVRQIKTKPVYAKSLEFVGFVFMLIGITIEVSAFL